MIHPKKINELDFWNSEKLDVILQIQKLVSNDQKDLSIIRCLLKVKYSILSYLLIKILPYS